jgi:hypothetical protein
MQNLFIMLITNDSLVTTIIPKAKYKYRMTAMFSRVFYIVEKIRLTKLHYKIYYHTKFQCPIAVR